MCAGGTKMMRAAELGESGSAKKRGTENFGPPGFPDRSRRSEDELHPKLANARIMRGLRMPEVGSL
jgi:hypothetical protein